MLGLVTLTMVIMYFLPKITKKMPAALVAIICVASLTIFGGINVNTVGSFIVDSGGTGLEGSLPSFQYFYTDVLSLKVGNVIISTDS